MPIEKYKSMTEIYETATVIGILKNINWTKGYNFVIFEYENFWNPQYKHDVQLTLKKLKKIWNRKKFLIN